MMRSLFLALALDSQSPDQLLQEGRIQYQNRQYESAAQVWQQAEQAFAAKGDRLNQAIVLNNLALVYQQLSQPKQATAAIETSLQQLGCPPIGLFCTLPTSEQTQVYAQLLTTLGTLQLAQGQADEAYQTWQVARDRYAQVNDSAGVLRSQLNQSQALRSKGLYRRNLTGLQQLYPNLSESIDPALRTTTLLNYGDALRSMGRFTEAQQQLEQGLKLAKSNQLPLEISTAYLNLGNTQRAQLRPEQRDRQKRLTQILNYYQQSAAIAPDPLLKIQAQLNQLTLPIDPASQTALNASAIAESIRLEFANLPMSRNKTYAQINYAKLLIKQQTPTESVPFGKPCQASTPSGNTAIETILKDAIQASQDLKDAQAQSFALGTLGYWYETQSQCETAIALTREALAIAQSQKIPDIAYRWQWQMGRLYRNLAASSSNPDRLNDQPNYQTAIQFYQTAFNTLQSLRRDLSTGNPETQFTFQEQTEDPIYREFVDLLLRPTNPSQPNLRLARTIISSLQIAELENFLQEPCFVTNPESIDQVADEPQSTTAALYPIILNDRIEVILKLPRQSDLVRYSVPIASKDVKEVLDRFQVKLQEDYAFELVKEDAQTIYKWLIEPARAKLDAAQVKTLVFLPDSQFRNVPMAALYDGKQYLVENFATTLSLNLALQKPKPLPPQVRVLAASLAEPPENFSQFGSLANVGKELDAIEKAGLSVVTLRDQQFTTKNFSRSINDSPVSIVHLATHGQFSSDPNQTFLLTATGSIKVDDLGSLFRTRGLNRSDEIELLVLSACETASGDSRATLGMAGTTLRAGARSTIASLWSLDDESSVELMKQFYQRLGQGTSRAEALRQAQLSLLSSSQYNYPRFWAPLILLGNWL